MPELLDRPIEEFELIGPYLKGRLHTLGIFTLRDLLFYFPTRYEDFSVIKPVSEVKNEEEVTCQGTIKQIKTIRTFKRKMFITEAYLEDNTGVIKIVWFNQPFLTKNIKQGDLVSISGKVKYSKGSFYFSSPYYEHIKEGVELKHTSGLLSVYPETRGITSKWIRSLIARYIEKYGSTFQDPMPTDVLKHHKFPPLLKALQDIHFPKDTNDAEIARQRFIFENLLLMQIIFRLQKKKIHQLTAPKVKINKAAMKKFVQGLPFSLTDDQKNAITQILNDLIKTFPMNRILEGEVGSGKTVVAALVAHQVMESGLQVVLMAPTEILAEQHYREIENLFKKFNYSIGLLTHSYTILNRKESTKKDIISAAQKGSVQILIGTHAVIQDYVKFKNLGLVIVDEQHRFGINQRGALVKKEKTENARIPHFLSMSATPIPRSLSLAFYGDLELSQIMQLPKGRKKISIQITVPSEQKKIFEFMRSQIEEGHQAFVVCPLIDESEKIQTASVIKEFERLKKIFPQFKLGLLHGRLKPEEKETVMKDFKENKIQVLVSTPVIEVGIDVPNATVMIIEGSERFGLAQLYQLKGRIGRGEYQSFCFLFTSSNEKSTSKRLEAIITAKNSFELAEKDLAIRGPGGVLGTKQSGIPDVLMKNLTNLSLLGDAKEEAEIILQKGLSAYPLMKNRVYQFQQVVHLE